MPARFEEVTVFAVLTILVGLFTWIYFRDRQQKSGLWLLGWVAILIHFAAPVIAHFLYSSPAPVTYWINRATLIVAGTFFLLSVSAVTARKQQRTLVTILISSAAVIYVTALALGLRQPWIYVSLLAGGACLGAWNSLHRYGWKSWFWRGVWLVIVPSVAWAMVQAVKGQPRRGLEVYLASIFAVTGLLYARHFRRSTPGVIFTSISFLAWGGVFPLGTILYAHHVTLSGVIWDLPKYFVAFGMILTLFENQTEVATVVARQYKGLFEGNLAAVYVSTFEGKLLDCNSAFLEMYGFESKEEALASSRVSVCDNVSERDAFFDTLNRNGQVLNYECRHRRKDGTPFWILERATIVTDFSGHHVIEGTAIDITERKQTEIALKQSEERFATIFRQSPVGCAIVSLEGVFLNVNEHFLRMIGRPPEQVIGKTSVELGFFKAQEERDEFYRRLRAEGSVQNMEVRFNDAFGNRHEGLYFANLVAIGDRECIFGMMLDQTDQRDLETKFLQAQKMEALGRLAGGVAHDFNNLLGIIGGYAELLENKLAADENFRPYCAKILETTQRAGGLTRQLLTFSRKEITRPMPLRPDQAIRELAAILPRMIGEDVELVCNLCSTGTLVMDKTHFEQIILNVVVNARDAMPKGGQLLIEAEDVFRPSMSSSGSVAIRQFVAIRIRDTGIGMSEETIAHAFEPFYTTKGVGRGTGLGLATVYGIVQQCLGEISIESQPGHGTAVNILLPVAVETEPAASDGASHEVKKGTGHILLVEDEVELRNANAEFLTAVGYSVSCASSGPEALQMVSNAKKIDLVITDVVMPRMNGREFADRLLQVRPDTKLLFVSGHADDVVLRTGLSMQSMPFLQKPYSLKQLGSVVHELLHNGNGQ